MGESAWAARVSVIRLALAASVCGAGVVTGLWFGVWCAVLLPLYYFQDNQGRRFTERGLEKLPTKFQTIVTILATTALMNLAVISASIIWIIQGIYSGPYPSYPPSLNL